jgi:AcrR family transcriptional regulator
MRSRAASAETTRASILQAALVLLRNSFRSDIRLEDIAKNAGVTVQTVLRLYGSRAELLDQAITELLQEIGSQVHTAEPGNVAGSISAIVSHYEEAGDLVIRSLADEAEPGMGQILAVGRSQHRLWVEEQFAPQIACYRAVERDRLVDSLDCVTDVYIWKKLRRDMGRSRLEAEATMVMMVRVLLGGQ